MKKLTGIAAIIALATSLTWAADQLTTWLGFQQAPSAQDQPPSGNEGTRHALVEPSPNPPGNEGILPSNNTAPEAQTDNQSPPSPDLSAEVASIEEDLARIEEALESDEVLEEFTPSEPLSADNPIPMPTDI